MVTGERLLFLGVIFFLLAALLAEGRQAYRASAAGAREVPASDLYERIRQAPASIQIVDIRPLEDFKDGHLPGAVNLPEAALAPHAPIDRYKRTVIVSEDGTEPAVEGLRREFGAAQTLAGGMSAWWKARLPEESGLFDPSKKARGPAGCL